MRVLSYSCHKCGNSGYSEEFADGLCDCPFGMTMRRRWNPDYRPAKMPPLPRPEVTGIGDDDLLAPMRGYSMKATSRKGYDLAPPAGVHRAKRIF